MVKNILKFDKVKFECLHSHIWTLFEHILFPEMRVIKKSFTRAAAKKFFLTNFPEFFQTHFQISKQL